MSTLTFPVAIAFLGAGLAVALASTTVATAQSDSLIVPWERVGPVHLGMYREDVAKALGKPNKADLDPNHQASNVGGGCDFYWYGKKYRVLSICYSDPPYQVKWVTVKYLDKYATAKGIRTGNGDSVHGSSIRDVLGTYGSADYQGCPGAHRCFVNYKSLGIVFSYEPQDNEVFEISVP